MFIEGIFAGVFAAVFQNGGYICSRNYIKRGGTALNLLVGTQLFMGAAGLVILPFAVEELQWDFDVKIILPLLGSAYGSLFGQFFFFQSERFLEPAKLSSLMGLRVVLLSMLSFILLGDTYNYWQISAIFMAATSAFVLNWQGHQLQYRGLGSLFFSLLSYAVSDLSVMHLVRGIGQDNLLGGALIAMALVNILLALSVLPWALQLPRRQLKKAMPFSVMWLFKQLFLYLCYGLIGPVFGNVIMALRGPIALVMQSLLRYYHYQERPSRAERQNRYRQIAATLLMTVAIAVYMLT